MKIHFVRSCIASVTLLVGSFSVSAQPLHNGIVLPKEWPPRYEEPVIRKEMPVPYLKVKPAVIPVNVGRQLFVDDFLIESTNLIATAHTAKYSDKNPILEPDKEWETNASGPYAAPFSDGIWFDEKDNTFKMWYLAGAPGRGRQAFYTCYAESKNGVNWMKPELNVYGKTNVVDTFSRDAATIWLDKKEKDPDKRFKMVLVMKRNTDDRWQYVLKYSADGIHWSKGMAQSGDLYDRSTIFYNPFLSKWVVSMRYSTAIGRSRSYLQHADIATAVSLAHRIRKDADDANIVPWFGADDKDPHNPGYPVIEPQIYNHDAIAYESIMLNYFSVWQGPENDVCEKEGIQKRNEVLVGYSRDGFHIARPSHIPFMGVNETPGAWNWGNIQSIAGVPLIKGDSLYFYVSGRRLNKKMWDSYTSTGLATLRRDGFVSMNTDDEGYLTTRDLVFTGDYFFINADIRGDLRVALLDASGKPFPGYTKEDCIPLKGNNTKHMITWKNKKNTSGLENSPVKVKFYITNGDLYSFWVSKWETGESSGYTGGGGPGLSQSGIDTR